MLASQTPQIEALEPRRLLSGAFHTLHTFVFGGYTWDRVDADTAGNVYGMTDKGGNYDLGTIYRLQAGTRN